MPSRPHLEISSTDPYHRGYQRGAQVATELRRSWPIYQDLFVACALDEGREPADVIAIADACLTGLSAWSPNLLRELEGVAAGSGLDLHSVMALNARTEVLAQARGAGFTECSTVVEMVGASGTALGAQTWDWHHDLADGWHVQTVRGDERTFVGLTEFGMLAKIGMNDAGLGVQFNLLRHESDAVGEHDADQPAPRVSVPVHLLAREVLGRASTVSEAVEIVGSASVSASTVLTVLTPSDAACIEISPAGIGVVEPVDGWLVHANHFLDPVLAKGEGLTFDETTTLERQDLLCSRITGLAGELDVEGLAKMLCAHDEDGIAVCRHPDAAAPMGYRTATLATVGLDPSRREAHISVGGPCRRTDIKTLSVRSSVA